MNTKHNMISGHARTAEPALVSAIEVARMLDISTRTLWRLLSAGKLPPPVRIGGSTRWRLDSIRHWIERGCPETNLDEG